MPLPTVQVFVSSTWLDLRPEREAVGAALQRLRETKYVGMEFFGSRDETTRRASLDEVDRSLVYVGLFAARYGSGITEAEYRRAREKGLPCFIYFKDDSTIAEDTRETDPAQTAKLEALKDELRREHIVTTFKNPDDLAARVTADLHRWLFDEYLSNNPAPLLPTLHQLRAPVGDFVGREKEINELISTLRGGSSAAITGISGMGGIGKTELSIYVAERLRDTYPDAQLVLDMRGTDERPLDPSDALASCIRAFHGLEQRLPDDLDELTHLYRSTLEGKRALILPDNAYDSVQVRPLIPPAGSALLITSRNKITLPGMKTRVTLDQLQPDEARELLVGIATSVAPDVAEQICELCGHLPLAIRAAGSLLDVTADLDASDYAAQLRDERTRLELIGAEGVDVSVEASFNLSYARLTPDAARVFRQLSIFPASFDAAAEEAVCRDSGHKYLTDLLRRNLVIYNPDARRYHLHDLTRLYAGARLREDGASGVSVRHANYYLNVLRAAGRLYEEGGKTAKQGLSIFDREWPNIRQGRRWSSERMNRSVTAATICANFSVVGGLLLRERKPPHDGVEWFESSLLASRRVKSRAAEVAILNSLGTAYSDLGEFPRAINLYEQALEISQTAGWRRDEGVALDNLGWVYGVIGEVRRAIEFNERALDIFRDINNRRDEALALNALGNVYLNIGEVQRAVELFEASLAITREEGYYHLQGMALGNLGRAYLLSGQTHLAIEFLNDALIVLREVESKRDEMIAMNNLGLAYQDLGMTREAIAIFSQVLTFAREWYDRLKEGWALCNLGRSYARLGQRQLAIQFYEQFLSVVSDIGDLVGKAVALWNLSLTMYDAGDREKAIANAQAALELYEKVEDPRAAEVRESLALWRGEQN